GEFLFFGMHEAFLGFFGPGGRGDLYKAVEEFPHPKIVPGRSEEHRLLPGLQIRLLVKTGIDPVDQFQIVPELPGMFGANDLLELGTVQVLKRNGFLYVLIAVAAEQGDVLFEDVVEALEAIARSDGETRWGDRESQCL